MGLRERKKQQTRNALIEAALDLFLAKGYDSTTIDQIAAAVDVSARTFFRYFASKEEVALAPTAHQNEIFLAELTARPETERPFTALSEAALAQLRILRDPDQAHSARFMKAQELIQATPALVNGQMRHVVDNEKKLLAEVARRQGTDPDDPRPQFVVSVFTGLALNAYAYGGQDLAAFTERLETMLKLAERSLRPGWDR